MAETKTETLPPKSGGKTVSETIVLRGGQNPDVQ